MKITINPKIIVAIINITMMIRDNLLRFGSLTEATYSLGSHISSGDGSWVVVPKRT